MLGFLELINNMLTSGIVPALFADDEKEAIIGQVKIALIHDRDVWRLKFLNSFEFSAPGLEDITLPKLG